MVSSVLENGLTVVVNERPGAAFVSIGFSVGVGSHNEAPEQLGIAHLTEHLVFKGTATRTVAQINRAIEELGGELNAYTCETRTVFTCTVLKRDLATAVDVLNDIVFYNTVPEDEFEKEKSVVLDELTMYADRGECRVDELANRAALPDLPSYWSVGGKIETVQAVTRDDVLAFIDANYVPANVRVVVTGDVTLDDVLALVEDDQPEFANMPVAVYHEQPVITPVQTNVVEPMNVGHSHVTFGWLLPTPFDERTKAVATLAVVALGSGLGSRLAQIREKYGYCYTINCYTEDYPDMAGVRGYAGTDLQNMDHLKQLVCEIFEEVAANGLEPWEHMRAVNTCTCELLRSAETTANATEMVISDLDHGRSVDVQLKTELYASITLDEVNQFIADRLTVNTISFAEIHQQGGIEEVDA